MKKNLPWMTYMPEDLEIQNHYLNDIITVFYPWKLHISERLKQGNLPLWCPELSLGYPLFAKGVGSLFSIPTPFYIFLEVSTAHNLSLIIEIFLAGVFMYCFVRELKIGTAGTILSAVAYMFNFLFMVYLLSECMVGAMLWLPLIFLFAERYKNQGKVSNLLLAGLFTGISILHSSLQSMLFIFLSLFLYMTLSYYQDSKKQRVPLGNYLLLLMGSVIIGMCVSAIKLIPDFELLSLNERGVQFSFSGWLSNFHKYMMMIPFLSAFIFPDLIGNHQSLDLFKLIGSSAGGRMWLSGDTFKAYIGILPFIFALCAVVFRKCQKTQIFLGISVIPILIFFFTPCSMILYSRVFLIYCFAGSVLAGLGVDYLLSSKNEKQEIARLKRYLGIILIVVVAVILVGDIILFFSRGWILPLGEKYIKSHIEQASGLNYDLNWQLNKLHKFLGHYSIFNKTMYFPLFIGASSYALFYLLAKDKIKKKLFVAFIVVITAFDLFRLGWDWLPMVDKNLIFPKTEATTFLENDRSLYRVISYWDRMKNPPVFQSNTLLPYNISDVRIYESLEPEILNDKQFLNLTNVKYIATPLDYEDLRPKYKLVYNKEIRIYENPDVLPRIFVVKRAIFLSDEERIYNEMSKPEFNPQEVVLLEAKNGKEMDLQHVESSSKSVAKILHYAPEKVEVEVAMAHDGFLVFSDRYYPGWKAYVNGKKTKIYKANMILRSVHLKKGDHLVKFVYKPLSLRVGFIISIMTLVGIFLVVGITLLKGRSNLTGKSEYGNTRV